LTATLNLKRGEMNIFRKILIILSILIIIPTKISAHGERFVGQYIYNGFVGYQFGLGNRAFVLHGFDANVVLGVFNGGYSYKFNFGSNTYWGVGFGSLLELQWGYAHSQRNKLFRIRTDIPLSLSKKKALRSFAVGAYWEKRLNDNRYSNNFGISLTIGITNLLWTSEN
jgi:hypothetical protein